MGSGIAIFECPGILVGHSAVVAKAEKISGAGPTGVFPLGFGGEAIDVARGYSAGLGLTFCHGRTVGEGIGVTDTFDWPAAKEHWGICVIPETAGVVSHDHLILALGDFVFGEPKVATDGDGLVLANKAARF